MSKKRKLVIGIFALLTVAVVAVCDEFIQSFTGRTSMVSDVLIGFLVAFLGGWMIARKRPKSGILSKS